MTAPVENALQNARIEYVEEVTEGETPSDPSWETFTDFLTELSVDPGGSNNEINVAGSGDIKQHFRGPEEPSLELSYYKQQPFVDSSGDAVYPAARPLTYQYDRAYPSFSFEYRRDVSSGGNFGSGFREYVIVKGAKPTEVETPGDPSEGEPIVESLTLEPEKARSYVLHQPDTGTTLDVTNNGTNSVDVTIEDEGAATAETVTVSGGATVTTTSTFSGVDAIEVAPEPDGDIEVTDGSGTNILDTPIAGSNTTNVEGERGIPALGTGSHGSTIGQDPAEYLFAGFEPADLGGSQLADRIHALDLSVSLDVSREARAGTRRQSVDIGTRTVEVSADLAGPFKSAELIADQFRNLEADLAYHFPDNDVTVRNARLAETPEYTRAAGDANYIPSVTFVGSERENAAAVTVTNTA